MDCGQCQGPRGRDVRARWGCDAPLDHRTATNVLDLSACGLSGHEPLVRCPNRTLPRGIGNVLLAYASWRDGVMFEAGGLNHQGAWYVDAMNCVGIIVDKLQQQDRQSRD